MYLCEKITITLIDTVVINHGCFHSWLNNIEIVMQGWLTYTKYTTTIMDMQQNICSGVKFVPPEPISQKICSVRTF